MIAGLAALPLDGALRIPHRRTVVRRCGDYRPFSHIHRSSKLTPLIWRRVASIHAGTCGHHANHVAECATRSHNPRTLDRTCEAEASNVAP